MNMESYAWNAHWSPGTTSILVYLKKKKEKKPACSCSFCTSPNHLLGGTCHHLEERIASNQDKWCIPSGFESMLYIFTGYLKVFKKVVHEHLSRLALFAPTQASPEGGKQEKGHFCVPVHLFEMNCCSVLRKIIIFEIDFLSLKREMLV